MRCSIVRSSRWCHQGWGIREVSVVIGELFQFFIVSVVKNLQFFLDGSPLSATDRTTARTLLLFLHLPQHCLLLDLDQRPPLLLAQLQPELLDVLPFSLGGGVPNVLARQPLGSSHCCT